MVASTQSLVLAAKEKFSAGRQVAQRRVFELATSKIDDLIGTSEYDWFVLFFSVLFFLYQFFANEIVGWQDNDAASSRGEHVRE